MIRFFSLRIKGFTLIELLIVVAIIAVLAAIAIPNFLEAQVRARVSRAKSDMRTIALALESYAADSDKYPSPGNDFGKPLASGFAVEWFETRSPVTLTTPVAYLTSLPRDIFNSDSGETPLFHYSTRDYVIRSEMSDEEFDVLAGEMIGDSRRVSFYLLSHGPDRDHDFSALGHDHEDGEGGEEGEEHEDHGHEHGEEAVPALYDPTNGTLSSGDIVYWGPGVGFRN